MTHLTEETVQDYIFSDSPYLGPEDQAHVLICEACKSKIESYKLLQHQFRRMEDPLLQPGVYESIQNQLSGKVRTDLKLPWHIPLAALTMGIILFLLPKIEFGSELPLQLGLGIAVAIVISCIEIKHIELIYKQKIKQVQ